MCPRLASNYSTTSLSRCCLGESRQQARTYTPPIGPAHEPTSGTLAPRCLQSTNKMTRSLHQLTARPFVQCCLSNFTAASLYRRLSRFDGAHQMPRQAPVLASWSVDSPSDGVLVSALYPFGHFSAPSRRSNLAIRELGFVNPERRWYNGLHYSYCPTPGLFQQKNRADTLKRLLFQAFCPAFMWGIVNLPRRSL